MSEAPKEKPTDSNESTAERTKNSECPICVMFRKGGCEEQFNNFMDCGINAEKGKADYKDCITAFESMRACMQKNPEAFKEVLSDVEFLASSSTEHPPQTE